MEFLGVKATFPPAYRQRRAQERVPALRTPTVHFDVTALRISKFIQIHSAQDVPLHNPPITILVLIPKSVLYLYKLVLQILILNRKTRV